MPVFDGILWPQGCVPHVSCDHWSPSREAVEDSAGHVRGVSHEPSRGSFGLSEPLTERGHIIDDLTVPHYDLVSVLRIKYW